MERLASCLEVDTIYVMGIHEGIHSLQLLEILWFMCATFGGTSAQCLMFNEDTSNLPGWERKAAGNGISG